MGIFKIIRNTNDGLRYMYNALNYIAYGHTYYDKRYSLNTDIDNAYEQFLLVKKYFGKTSGNPVFHFVVSFTTKTTRYNDIKHTEYLCRNIANYFADKYQIVWCIHEKRTSKRYGGIASVYHAHFVMNSVSYIDGKMFGGSNSEIYDFLEHIKNVTGIHLGLLSMVQIRIIIMKSKKMVFKCTLTGICLELISAIFYVIRLGDW